MEERTVPGKFSLSHPMLKWGALLFMAMDHFAVAFPVPEALYLVLRFIGRLSFPIFAFLVVEGVIHTHNIRKYFLRLGLFALISEFPFDCLLFHDIPFSQWFPTVFENQNVMFTLLLGAIGVYATIYFENQHKIWLGILATLAAMLLSIAMQTDYPGLGVILMYIFYLYRKSPVPRATAVLLLFLLTTTSLNRFGFLALIPIGLYNEEKPAEKGWQKWFFYVFYPLHMLVFGLLARFLF